MDKDKKSNSSKRSKKKYAPPRLEVAGSLLDAGNELWLASGADPL